MLKEKFIERKKLQVYAGVQAWQGFRHCNLYTFILAKKIKKDTGVLKKSIDVTVYYEKA